MATQADTRMTTGRIISLSLVALWLFIAAFPFLWTFWGSFKVQADFFSKA
ncbi:MAG: carbohydrate ABC transporter permease, partial [Pseudomonadota bacterium]